MKYRVTEKHRLLKEGIILEPNEDNHFSSEWAHEFSSDEVSDWIESGWIEEIQEPQFTEKDIKAFGNYCLYNHLCYGANNASEAFNNWIKKYKDEKETD